MIDSKKDATEQSCTLGREKACTKQAKVAGEVIDVKDLRAGRFFQLFLFRVVGVSPGLC